jgi:hypothetical protein
VIAVIAVMLFADSNHHSDFYSLTLFKGLKL